jgi:hypothetical protein
MFLNYGDRKAKGGRRLKGPYSGILGLYKDAMMSEDLKRMQHLYQIQIQEGEQAGPGLEFQGCKDLCPQGSLFQNGLRRRMT